MPGAEMFTVLAVLEARDKISEALGKAEGVVGRFSESLQRMAGVAEESGARTDEALLQTASGTDAMELANARLAAARDKATAATERQAAAEKALLDAQASLATEQELAVAAEKLAAADEKATAAATELKAAKSELAAMKKAKASEDELAGAAKALELAEKNAAVAVEELTAAQREQAALVTNKDVIAAADALTAAERKAATASKELTTAEKLQSDTSEAASAKTDAAAAAQGRFGAAMAKGSTVMGGASKLALGAGLAVAAIGYESVKAATSFQTLTTQLVTTAGEAPSALKQVQNGILQISTQTATSANDLAQSMYIVEASGYNAAHGGLDVLKAATEGARLENSDFKTVANGVTDILKDYHLGAGQAANYTSKLVSAVGHGKANFQQFSAALSNILPMGSAVGLKFNDLAGVLAEMTSHGVTAQRASQNMYNAMRNLENPTSVMTKEFKAVGINVKDLQQHLAQQGLGGTMQWLSGLAKDNASRLGQTYPAALAKLMGSSSGLSVALMTTGENAKDTNKAIKDIGGASADSKGNVQGFAQVQQTLGFKMGQAKQAIHNTGIALGTVLLPMVTRVMGVINRVLVPIAEWASKHQKLIGLILTSVGAMAAAAGAIKLVSIAMGILNAVMDANPISLIIIAIVALVAAVIYCWTHFKGFRDFWKAAWSMIVDAAKAAWSWLKRAFQGIVDGLTAAWRGTLAVGKTLLVWVYGLPLRIMGYLASLGGRLWSWATSAWRGAYRAAVSVGGTLLTWVYGLPMRILSAIGSLGSLLWNAGGDLIRGLWNGIAAMGSWLASMITGFIKSFVPGPVLKVLGINSPSRVFHEIGTHVTEGLALGITTNSDKAASASRHLAAATLQGFGSPQMETGQIGAGFAAVGSRALTSAVGATPGLVGGGGGASVVQLMLDLRGSQVMSERDMDQLVHKVGRAIATRILPGGGVRLAG